MAGALDPRLADPRILRWAVQRAKRRRAAQAATAVPSRVPRTYNDLWAYVATTWGVEIPRVAVCPGHVAPFRVFAEAFFAEHSVIVLKASRGLGGKSFLLAYLGLAQADLLGAEVVILGGSQKQSLNVHKYMVDAWKYERAPRDQLLSDPTQMRTVFRNGAQIEPIPASQKSVRGPHPQRQIQDEVDEMELKIHEAAMGQTMPRGGIAACTILSSTHQYANGTFTEVIKRAKEKGQPVYEYCYRETMVPHGWLALETVEQKRSDLTEAQWQSEVEGQEPSPESRAIDPPAVTAMFRRELGEYRGAPREYIEIEPPVEGALYVHGADWAKEQDWTEIVSLRIDYRPAHLIAYERMRRLPWPVMVGRFDERVTRFGGKAAHDATGIGNVVAGYMHVPAEDVLLVGRVRTDLFSEWINGIEQGQVVSPYIEALQSQYRYCSVNDLFGSGHPPDGFVAGALAYAVSGLGKKPPVFRIRSF